MSSTAAASSDSSVCPSTWSNARSIESEPTSAMARRRGRAHADVAGLQRHQGLVLDRAAQRDERPLVADVLQPQPPVEAEEEVGGPFGGAAHLHIRRAAVVEGGEEVRGNRPVAVVIAPRSVTVSPVGGEAGGHGRGRRVLVGPPEREQRGHADRGADGECEEHLGRELDREHDAHGHERGEQERARSSPAWTRRTAPAARTTPPAWRCPVAVMVLPDVHAGALGELVGDALRLVLVDEPDRRVHQCAGDDVGDDEVPEQPVAPQREREHEHAEDRPRPRAAARRRRGPVPPEARGSRARSTTSCSKPSTASCAYRVTSSRTTATTP